MNDTINTENTTTTAPTPQRDLWQARILPGLSYAISIGLIIAGPTLMGVALMLALLSGDASIVGLGLLAGAVLGAAGGGALLWCLGRGRHCSGS